ncbi:MAG: hypothetical protein NZM31_01330 [Gemmatales bacterium]|nr:hypothetical protein [Gemmatales bacterium]MDW8385638.1 hypothetical protein [Gemmatales bacterium]
MSWYRPSLFIVVCVLSGCAFKPDEKEQYTFPPVSADDPVCFRINTKGEVEINKRWVNVFNEQGRVRDYLEQLAAAHREHYESEGTTLPTVRRLGKSVIIIPSPIVLEPEAKTKAGTVLAMRRLCNEAGFVNVRVTVRDAENAGGQ